MICASHNSALAATAPDAPRPASAVLGRPSGAKPVPQPSRAGKGRNFSFPRERLAVIRAEFQEVRPVGCLARLISEAGAQAECRLAYGRLQASVNALLSRARTEAWSQRELSRRAGIPFRTWRRVRDGQVDALAWLPKLQPALARLTPS